MADPTPGAVPAPAPVPPAAVPTAAAAPSPAPAAAPMVTFDEFKKMDLRVAKVLSVEDHSNANKLYVIKADIGNGEVRQIVAGIKPFYAKEALVGKSVVVICNLQPAMLRGVQSQGMLLAASAAGSVIVLTTEKDAPAGSKVS
jgi:methionyl-tRNA synthetase